MMKILPPRPLRILILSLLIVAAIIVAVVLLTQGGDEGEPVIANIPCERGERLEYHVHAHLTVFVEALKVEISAGIGVARTCHYWLHTHDATGNVHVEAPSQGDFTLRQFFAIWGQPLSSTALLDRQSDGQHEIRAFVNGEPFQGDPADIPLRDNAVIVIAYGPPFPVP